MTSRARARSDFEDFVLVCSDRLLGLADLLIGDADRAEELLRDALARTWIGWRHLEDQPEPSVRRMLVSRQATWWRRAPRPAPDAPLAALTRRQRALVVLRVVDELSEEDAADLLGCSVATVRLQTARALATLGVGPDPGEATTEELRASLTAHTEQLESVPLRERLAGVDRRAGVLGRRRSVQRTVAGVVGAVALLAAVVLLPPPGTRGSGPVVPDPSPPNELPMVDPPPPLLDYPLALTNEQQGVDYEYARSEESPKGRGLLRVAVAPQQRPATIVWATSRGATGTMTVSVDGDAVESVPAGTLRSGLMLSKGRTHLVTIRHTAPTGTSRIGFALYTWPE